MVVFCRPTMLCVFFYLIILPGVILLVVYSTVVISLTDVVSGVVSVNVVGVVVSVIDGVSVGIKVTEVIALVDMLVIEDSVLV